MRCKLVQAPSGFAVPLSTVSCMLLLQREEQLTGDLDAAKLALLKEGSKVAKMKQMLEKTMVSVSALTEHYLLGTCTAARLHRRVQAPSNVLGSACHVILSKLSMSDAETAAMGRHHGPGAAGEGGCSCRSRFSQVMPASAWRSCVSGKCSRLITRRQDGLLLTFSPEPCMLLDKLSCNTGK